MEVGGYGGRGVGWWRGRGVGILTFKLSRGLRITCD